MGSQRNTSRRLSGLARRKPGEVSWLALALLLTAGASCCNTTPPPTTSARVRAAAGPGTRAARRPIPKRTGADHRDWRWWGARESHLLGAWIGGNGALGPRGLCRRSPRVYWLADGPGRGEHLVIDDDGAIVDRLRFLQGLVRGMEDIEVTDTHVYVLMVGGQQPIIARMGRNDAAATAWRPSTSPPTSSTSPTSPACARTARASWRSSWRSAASTCRCSPAMGHGLPLPGPRPRSTRSMATASSWSPRPARPRPTRRWFVVLSMAPRSRTVIETAGMLGDFAPLGATPDGDIRLRVADVGLPQGCLRHAHARLPLHPRRDLDAGGRDADAPRAGLGRAPDHSWIPRASSGS